MRMYVAKKNIGLNKGDVLYLSIDREDNRPGPNGETVMPTSHVIQFEAKHHLFVNGVNYGPFPSREYAEEWKERVEDLIAKGWWTASLKEVFLRQVERHEQAVMLAVSADEGVYEVDPEKHEPVLDNKNVIFRDNPGVRSYDFGHLVLVKGGKIGHGDPDREEMTWNTADVPMTIDLRETGPVYKRYTLPHDDFGQIVLVKNTTNCDIADWLVAWRLDGRRTNGLSVISGHSVPECAVARMKEIVHTYKPLQTLRPKPRQRDAQRQKVYDWEKGGFGSLRLLERISIQEAQVLVNSIWKESGLPNPPRCSYDRRLTKSGGTGGRLALKFHRPDPSRGIVLHELAHAFVFGLGIKDPGHGPAFVDIAMRLYERHGGADAHAMQAKADAMRVNYDVLTVEQERVFDQDDINMQYAGPSI